MDGGVAVTPSMGSTKSGGSGGDEPPNPEQIDKMLKRASEVTVTDELAWDDSWADLEKSFSELTTPGGEWMSMMQRRANDEQIAEQLGFFTGTTFN